jgi:hypothetical protein
MSVLLASFFLEGKKRLVEVMVENLAWMAA